MKILVVTAAYPAPTDPVRAVYIETLTRALVESRTEPSGPVEVRVVAPRIQRDDPRAEVRRGIPIRRFRYPSRGRRLKELGNPPAWMLGAYVVSALGAVSRELLSWRPDVILGHWVVPIGPVVTLAARLHRRPCILVAHGSDVHRYAVRSRLMRRIARYAARRARRVIAVSQELSRLLVEELDVSADAIRVLPMGVDEDVFSPSPREVPGGRGREKIREALAMDPGVVMLLFVGDLIVEKGLREAVEALRKLRAEGRPVELCVVGDGPLRGEIEGLLSDGEPGLRALGPQPQEVVADWYRASDLLVLPSYGEGTPLVVMEALTCGLPVVASCVGGIPELVEDGRTGRLIAPRSAESLAQALRDVLVPEVLESLRRGVATGTPGYGVRRLAQALLQEMRECLPTVSRSASHADPSRGGTDG